MPDLPLSCRERLPDLPVLRHETPPSLPTVRSSPRTQVERLPVLRLRWRRDGWRTWRASARAQPGRPLTTLDIRRANSNSLRACGNGPPTWRAIRVTSPGLRPPSPMREGLERPEMPEWRRMWLPSPRRRGAGVRSTTIRRHLHARLYDEAGYFCGSNSSRICGSAPVPSISFRARSPSPGCTSTGRDASTSTDVAKPSLRASSTVARTQ